MLNGVDYFHWITTRLLFASKRARLDLQVAVAYLCKRVKSPTILDYQKLTTSVVKDIYTWLSPSIYLYYREKKYSLSVKFLHILIFRISEYYNTVYYWSKILIFGVVSACACMIFLRYDKDIKKGRSN